LPILLDFIDPGNSGGSVRVPDAPRVVPLSFLCPYCPLQFETEIGRANHVNEQHPVRHPVLLVEGQPVPSAHFVRRRIGASEFAVHDCDDIYLSIDGGASRKVGLIRLGHILTGLTQAFVVLRLVNSQAETMHEISVRIPDESELGRVDQLFSDHLAKDDVGIREVDRFREATSGYGSCKDYVSGLADYVLGVLVKDQAGGTTLPFEKHQEKFDAALACLSDYERPLGRSISNCIRLNLNQFDGTWRSTGVVPLDAAMAYYLAKIRPVDARPVSGRKLPAVLRRFCPVDETTAFLLEAITAWTSSGQISNVVTRQLEHRASIGRVSHADRIKFHVLLADVRLGSGDRDGAAQHVARVMYDHDFGQWARENGAVG